MKQVNDYPEIQTERLRLRRVRLSDASAMLIYMSDEDTVRWLSGVRKQTITEIAQSIRDYFWHDEPGTMKYAIADLETDELIGTIDFRYHSNQNDAEIGYVLTPQRRGNGYVSEAVRALLHIGFTELAINVIWIGHDQGNVRSRRVPQRLGFHTEGVDSKGHQIWTLTKRQYLVMQ